MFYLVNRIVATGADVFHPGQSLAAVSTDDDNSSSPDTGANIEAVSGSYSTLLDAVVDEIMDDEDQSGVHCLNYINPFFSGSNLI